MMMQTLFTILATAVLSSLITLMIAIHYFRKHAKPRYDKAVGDAIERFKAEVGPEIEQRVKQGILEGIKSLPTREMLRDTTRTIAKTGLDIVGDGLKIATRTTRPRRPGGTPLDDD
jgi:hypothetical protein